MINVPTKFGNLEVKFCSKDYCYISSDKLKINGVLYKISAYMHLHSNRTWESYSEGNNSYEGRPYLHRVDGHANTVWGKDPTPTAYRMVRELVETEFRNKVGNWNKEIEQAEVEHLEKEISDKEREIKEEQEKLNKIKDEKIELMRRKQESVQRLNNLA